MDRDAGWAVLAEAAALNGLSADGVEVIRNGSHLMCRLEDGPVGRVGERGTEVAARREVEMARWLASHGFSAVRAAVGLVQPTVVVGCPVTWWEPLPPHRPATPAELGLVLRELHNLPVPAELKLPAFAPLEPVRRRAVDAPVLDERDRAWLRQRIAELDDALTTSVIGRQERLIHGDAWQGNVAVPADGRPVLLDLEAVCIGPAEWDLVSVAVDATDFARISVGEYESFVAAYGADVTAIPEYRLLADIQELRWTAYVIGKATHDRDAAVESAHRLSCLRGEVPRPWTWRPF